MKKTNELETVQMLFLALGRKQKEELLDGSNLNDRELELMKDRFIKGLSLKDCANIMGIEEDSVNKAQLKAVKKLFIFLNMQKMCK